LGQRRAREPFTGLDDVLFSPLSMATLVRMLPRMLASPRSGVFNLGSRDGMSKAAFEMALGSPCPSLHREIERVERGDASAQQ
jgi:dTDP-4-dehydrorhamnose reductase